MTEGTEGKKTALYDVQARAGARFVTFAGYQMPVQFAGVVAEHKAVRQRVGLFDVSHMGEIVIAGPQALDAVQHLITNNAGKLPHGKALYTVMCLPSGGIVDDLIVYREAENRFFLCVNASRRQADYDHMCAHTESFECDVTDRSESYSQLALQGPRAADVLGRLTQDAPVDVHTMPAFAWADVPVAGIDMVRVARTGYTGEHGFELYCSNAVAADLWEAIVTAGEEHGLTLCGLGARDTLRLEVKFPLYGNDIDVDHNPYEAGLGWTVKLKKPPFVGREVLEQVKRDGPQRKWVGFKMVDRGIPRQGYPILAEGTEVGAVTSGTHSPMLAEPIGTGYVPTALAAPGTSLQILIRNKAVAAQVVETPFYKRESS